MNCYNYDVDVLLGGLITKVSAKNLSKPISSEKAPWTAIAELAYVYCASTSARGVRVLQKSELV